VIYSKFGTMFLMGSRLSVIFCVDLKTKMAALVFDWQTHIDFSKMSWMNSTLGENVFKKKTA